jgi:hypothetical protein
MLKVGNAICLDTMREKGQSEKIIKKLTEELYKFPALINWQLNVPGCVRDIIKFPESAK